jgi:TBC1 domain family protein 5
VFFLSSNFFLFSGLLILHHFQSPWNAIRMSESVCEEIMRDVERCMPDNAYFRQPSTQKLLVDVLFVWCCLNPTVGYRQGMHEVLAPVVWVVERDSIPAQNNSRDDGDVLAGMIMDVAYVEHDCFAIFDAIMSTAKSYYEPAPEKSVTEDTPSETPMIKRARRIFSTLLANADPELESHLESIDIMPQIFLM